MASVWGELKRRNVVKVAVAYAIVGWLLVEVSSVLAPALRLPDSATTFVAFLLILGFPVAMLLTWAYELTPEGMQKSKAVPLSESIAHITGRKLDFVIIGVLSVAVAFFVLERFLQQEPSETGTVADEPGEALQPVVVEEQPEVLPNSVAVLLCDNLSPDPDDAFFAEGIHEEILNQLVKIRALSVIARTSVLQYADAPPPIPQIAEELRVGAVMECSVRFAGDSIMVTAQLIDPKTNSHLWSDTYPGDLSDLSTVFAIQADIAMNIANALEAEFSLEEQASIEKIPTESPAAYSLYLRAIDSWSRGGGTWRSEMDQAIALDSTFALAYATRAANDTFRLVGVASGLAPSDALELERNILEDAEHALSIDPTLGLAHAALAAVHQANWRGAAAEQAFRSAVELSPSDVVLLAYGRFKRYRGEYAEAVRLMRRAMELNPNASGLNFQLGLVYRDATDWDAAATAIQEAVNATPANPAWNLQFGWVEAARSNAAEAVRQLQLAEQLGGTGVFRLAQMARAYALAGRPADAMRLFAQFEERATEEGVGEGWWAHAYIAVGDYGQAFQRIESAVNNRVSADQAALANLAANPWGDSELEKPEFRELLDGLWDD